jgi:hypothetical protein
MVYAGSAVYRNAWNEATLRTVLACSKQLSAHQTPDA